jgi:predicted lipoprotein
MSAMETMLANMIGLKPQEMKEMAERIQSGFLEMAGAINRIENNTVAILAALEEQDAGRKQLTNGSDDNDPGKQLDDRNINGAVN